MPGFAKTSSSADSGSANNIHAMNIPVENTVIFTATQKTRLDTVLVTNKYGSYLPLDLWVQSESAIHYLARKFRVLNQRLLVARGADALSGGFVDPGTITADIIMMPGEQLVAKAPKANTFDLVAAISEGVN